MPIHGEPASGKQAEPVPLHATGPETTGVVGDTAGPTDNGQQAARTDSLAHPLLTRRQIQTRADIHRVAIDLAMAKPVSEITVEEIAKAAGVSRRTFFNYFASKDDAFVPAVSEIPADIADAFVRGEGENADLLTAASALLQARASYLGPSLASHRNLIDVKHDNPQLHPLFMKAVRTFELKLRGLLAQRLGRDEEDPEVVASACLISSVEKASLDVWLHSEPQRSFGEVVDQLLAGLRAAIAGSVLDSAHT